MNRLSWWISHIHSSSSLIWVHHSVQGLRSIFYQCNLCLQPNVVVNAIIGLPFPIATGSILDMNDNVIEMTQVNERPFKIDFRSQSNKTPVVGTHSASVDEKKYGLFLRNLKEIGAHVDVKWAEPLGKGFQRVKKLWFANNDANTDFKRTKLDGT